MYRSVSGWEELGADIPRLVENIRNMYPDLVESLIREVIQNAYDARYKEGEPGYRPLVININYDAKQDIFTCVDNGKGMTEREFKDFFIIAKTSKDPRQNIGQFGWGKISYIASGSFVIIEIKSEKFHGARLIQGTRHRPIGTGRLTDTGTIVEIHGVEPEIAARLTRSNIERIVRKYYNWLLREGIRIYVQGKLVEYRVPPHDLKVPVDLKVPLFGRITGHVYHATGKLGDHEKGIGVVVLGQTVIREDFGITHPEMQNIFGEIRADFLSIYKTSLHMDFRSGAAWRETCDVMKKFLEKKVLPQVAEIKKEKFARRLERKLDEILRILKQVLREVPELDPRCMRCRPVIQKKEIKPIKVFVKVRERRRRKVREGKKKSRGGPGALIMFYEDRKPGAEEHMFYEDMIYINIAHSAFKAARAKKILDYHIWKCIANELIRQKKMELVSSGLDKAKLFDKIYELRSKFYTSWGKIYLQERLVEAEW
jgi:hypothetical protein